SEETTSMAIATKRQKLLATHIGVGFSFIGNGAPGLGRYGEGVGCEEPNVTLQHPTPACAEIFLVRIFFL
ncbi:MAG: hypothetical protein ACU0CN_17425, partial [Pseudooceanicola nanhaiensis]|uniref:hypothetical protein n=1 Tax=Pseudooceanicola nanhaiensis TaxID=375761 RepID=UPI004059DAD5